MTAVSGVDDSCWCAVAETHSSTRITVRRYIYEYFVV